MYADTSNGLSLVRLKWITKFSFQEPRIEHVLLENYLNNCYEYLFIVKISKRRNDLISTRKTSIIMMKNDF